MPYLVGRFAFFGLFPLPIQLGWSEIGSFQSFLCQRVFNQAYPAGKPLGCIPAGTFGVHFSVSGQIYQSKEEIPQFPGEGGTPTLCLAKLS